MQRAASPAYHQTFAPGDMQPIDDWHRRRAATPQTLQTENKIRSVGNRTEDGSFLLENWP
jgi:hypothetical protein